MGYRGLLKTTVSDGDTFRSLPANAVRFGYKVSQKVYHANSGPKICLMQRLVFPRALKVGYSIRPESTHISWGNCGPTSIIKMPSADVLSIDVGPQLPQEMR